MIAKYIVPGDSIALPDGQHVTITEKSDYIAPIDAGGWQLRERFTYHGGEWDCPATYEVTLITLNQVDHHG